MHDVMLIQSANSSVKVWYLIGCQGRGCALLTRCLFLTVDWKTLEARRRQTEAEGKHHQLSGSVAERNGNLTRLKQAYKVRKHSDRRFTRPKWPLCLFFRIEALVRRRALKASGMGSVWEQEPHTRRQQTSACGEMSVFKAGCGPRSRVMVSNWCSDADVNKAAAVHRFKMARSLSSF